MPLTRTTAARARRRTRGSGPPRTTVPAEQRRTRPGIEPSTTKCERPAFIGSGEVLGDLHARRVEEQRGPLDRRQFAVDAPATASTVKRLPLESGEHSCRPVSSGGDDDGGSCCLRSPASGARVPRARSPRPRRGWRHRPEVTAASRSRAMRTDARRVCAAGFRRPHSIPLCRSEGSSAGGRRRSGGVSRRSRCCRAEKQLDQQPVAGCTMTRSRRPVGASIRASSPLCVGSADGDRSTHATGGSRR